MGLPRTSWVKLDCLRTGVGRFYSSTYKLGLAPTPNCECGATDQTADHVTSTCPIHRAPQGVARLTVLDDDTRCWLNTTAASIYPIGFLDAPPYEQEVVAVLKKNCRKISALTSKNEFIQKQYESLGIVIAKLFIANST